MNAIIETKLTIISWKKNLTMISFDHIKFQLKINWQEIKTDPKHIDKSCIRVYLLEDFNIYFAWILDSDSNHEMETIMISIFEKEKSTNLQNLILNILLQNYCKERKMRHNSWTD